MNQGPVELVFILDRSGSMVNLVEDTIGGYNAMLQRHQAMEGECRITTVLFDHESTLLHDRADLRGVKPITEKDYFVGGSTALLDAIGSTILKIKHAQSHVDEAYRASQVLFVIITDGEENSSCEYSASHVKRLIKQQEAEAKWEFLFLGANIDSVTAAESIGIKRERAIDYRPDSEGTAVLYEAVSRVAQTLRSEQRIDQAILDELREDYSERP